MTDDELLTDSYQKILSEIKENRKYLEKDNFEYTQELIEECDDVTAILNDIFSEINGIASLNALDEEDYAFMYEMLNSYAEIFVVDGRTQESLKKDSEIFEQLMDILSLLEKNYVPQDYSSDDEENSEENF